MTALPALRAPHEPGLTGGVRREVVVVHVPLRFLGGEGVEQLLHLEHAQRGYVQDLGLASLEQAGAVGTFDDADLGAQRPEIAGTAPVEADRKSVGREGGRSGEGAGAWRERLR